MGSAEDNRVLRGIDRILELYRGPEAGNIEIVVIDHHFPGIVENGKVEVDEFVDYHVNPYLVGGDSNITAGALSVEVANMVNPDIIDTIKHLPGIAAVGDHAQSNETTQYIQIADNKGYDIKTLDKIAECIDFEAYYLRYMNGRGIIDTILDLENKDKHEKLIISIQSRADQDRDLRIKPPRNIVHEGLCCRVFR